MQTIEHLVSCGCPYEITAIIKAAVNLTAAWEKDSYIHADLFAELRHALREAGLPLENLDANR